MPAIFAKQTVYLLRTIFLLVVLFVLSELVSAQTDSNSSTGNAKDTLPVAGTAQFIRHDSLSTGKIDSLSIEQPADSVSKKPSHLKWEINPDLPFSTQVLQHNPYFGFGSKPVVIHSDLKKFKGKDTIFYALIAILLAFALLRQAFPKYFNDLLRLLFRTTLKQKQIREQMMQMAFPSLLLNVFFAISGGLYLDLLFQHIGFIPVDNFWLLFLYCSIGISIIYMVKYVGLKVTGWLFNIRNAADTYIFVVFIINKVAGIFLLPFLVLLSFMQGNAYSVALVLSWCGLGLLLIYRFLFTYATVRNQVRFNPFHFFLYLCAFEIAPLLLIYKALLFFFQ